MESRGRNLLSLLAEHDPGSPEFRNRVRTTLRTAEQHSAHLPGNAQFDLRDVFVQRGLPWGRFVQSAVLHGAALALIWTASISWIRQQKILESTTFDRSSLVTYTPEEYLPPLDTGVTEAAEKRTGDPIYAKQAILSVPREADNRSQTIVAPPDLKLNHDVALPNIVATGAVVPAVPLDATQSPRPRMIAPETQVVAPAPDVQYAPDRVVNSAMKSDVIAPPPEVSQSAKSKVGMINIGPSEVVAPAPMLTVAEQHAASGRGTGRFPAGSEQAVAPPPSVAAAGGTSSGGRLIALGIRPIAPSGPVAVPEGNRRGTFSATPQGKPGAAGTPNSAGGRGEADAKASSGSLPAGLHVGRGDAAAREMARAASSSLESEAATRAHDPSLVPIERATELDRQVFGNKTFHTMALNMPNLNSATGSWVIHFAELDSGKKEGELTAPRSTEKSDPGYPLDLIRANVHGMVSLYAVIGVDGTVTGVRVLNSPDDRLDTYAAKALYLCKFKPAERAGKPVALEALIMIPFRAKRSF